jgi:hypothetical protein
MPSAAPEKRLPPPEATLEAVKMVCRLVVYWGLKGQKTGLKLIDDELNNGTPNKRLLTDPFLEGGPNKGLSLGRHPCFSRRAVDTTARGEQTPKPFRNRLLPVSPRILPTGTQNVSFVRL